MCGGKNRPDRYREIRNRKVSHNYFVGDTYEAGIILRGAEVKSIREGKAQINEAFARVDRGTVRLYQAHIDEYRFETDSTHDPKRSRKLLLHKKEIQRLQATINAGGQTLIPLRLYFKGCRVKVEIALCKGKKNFDKRQALKKKTELNEARRATQASLRDKR